MEMAICDCLEPVGGCKQHYNNVQIFQFLR